MDLGRIVGRLKVVEHCVVPTRDGRQLSARIWRRDDLGPVPAILEYIPYRKRDFLRSRDEPIHAYLAANGYASVRLDIAGSGDSEGVLSDEYALQEQDDALDAIDWISRQDWCSGEVGMIGKSWGGFNCLQVAARRPQALKAIIPVCATDDRYADDVHFMGGCMLVDGLDWGAVFQSFLPRPPDPLILGDRWEDVWRERLDALSFPLETWVSHQRRDDYWKHGSVCEDYGNIEVPTLLIGGWSDGYKNALMRMAAKLLCPTRCIMGPWGHLYPHSGKPGPAIGFLQEVVRWFDFWLKGVQNGVMEEPKLVAWIQESEPPQTQYDVRKGRWVGEMQWPSSSVSTLAWHLTRDGLSKERGPLPETPLPYELSVGQFGGDWGGFAMPFEHAPDQRQDDALSLCFDSSPLVAPLEILGAPRIKLRIQSDKPIAQLAIRLNDVRPDGSVVKVTMGLLNLTHRSSHESPETLEIGRWYDVEVALADTGYLFPAMHRLRVALSPSYWPLAWPTSEPVRLAIRDPSYLELPRRQVSQEINVKFQLPEEASGPEIVNVNPAPPFQRKAFFDFTSSTWTRQLSGAGAFGAEGLNHIKDIDLTLENTMEREHSITLGNPLSASAFFKQQINFERPNWKVEIKTNVRVRSTLSSFLLNCDVDVRKNGDRVFTRSWNKNLPRDGL